MTGRIYNVNLEKPKALEGMTKAGSECVMTKAEQDALIWYKGHPDAIYREPGADEDSSSSDLYIVAVDFIQKAFGIKGLEDEDDNDFSVNGGEPANIVVMPDGVTCVDYLVEDVEMRGQPTRSLHVVMIGIVLRRAADGNKWGEFAITKATVYMDGQEPKGEGSGDTPSDLFHGQAGRCLEVLEISGHSPAGVDEMSDMMNRHMALVEEGQARALESFRKALDRLDESSRQMREELHGLCAMFSSRPRPAARSVASVDICSPKFIRGKTVVFTGSVKGMTRADLKACAEAAGAKVKNGVSKGVDILYTGKDASPEKLREASILSIPCYGLADAIQYYGWKPAAKAAAPELRKVYPDEVLSSPEFAEMDDITTFVGDGTCTAVFVGGFDAFAASGMKPGCAQTSKAAFMKAHKAFPAAVAYSAFCWETGDLSSFYVKGISEEKDAQRLGEILGLRDDWVPGDPLLYLEDE